MFKGDTIPGVLFVILGGLFIFPSLSLGIASPTSDGVPGPGFFPFIMALMVVVFGLILFIRGIKANGSFEYFKLEDAQKKNKKLFFTTVFAILVFLALWKLTTFLIAAASISLFLNWTYERTLKFNAVYTVLFVGLIYFVFNMLLRVQFVI
ncbi:tripartite tricarboxylate transporter TctB family protein [Geosporobacter ferrireducens]|uniref:DUF1468 domain-containing protein n=1 Tax=Geosporobacter ferrireducens TaxID=1424294 RepID=A0A1D8GFH3_9FIRM|nr:tripartite tricarboxylate transporter TctB family protein [Geosporobacter ferrireducens]AOT69643.1 hypothetical protein Gferi_08670 [Geosporobacter ferrireducens]MTI54652.1 tripartite tricarboxylate transporter TctB family protein [Geosporobacter ferrireducens]